MRQWSIWQSRSTTKPTLFRQFFLNYCRRKGEGDFIGCAQLLYIWIRSHFWGKCEASLRFCMSTMVPIKEFCQKQWPKDQTREQWIAALQDLDPAHVTWKALWMNQWGVLYGCGDKCGFLCWDCGELSTMLHCSCVDNMHRNSSFRPLMDLIC